MSESPNEIYGSGVLMPESWAGREWSFAPLDYTTLDLTIYPLASDDSFGEGDE